MGARILCGAAWALLTGLSAAPTWADTLVVDDDGSPGASFQDAQAAVDTAQPGDVIVVLAGDYTPVTIDGKSVTLMGRDGVVFQPGSVVRNLAAGQRALLVGMELTTLAVHDCAGTVVLDSVGLTDDVYMLPDVAYPDQILDVQNSTDVRLLKTRVVHDEHPSPDPFLGDGADALSISADAGTPSRVEVAQSWLEGSPGWDSIPFGSVSPAGGAAVSVKDASRVHLAATSFRGGDGGFVCANETGGSGGAALRLQQQSVAIAAGTSIETGCGGNADISDNGESGYGGAGAYLTPQPYAKNVLRYSSFQWLGGFDYYGQNQTSSIIKSGPKNTVEVPVLPDPVLELVGDLATGQPASLRLHAAPGAVGQLSLGLTPIVQPAGNPEIELLVAPLRIVNLGFVSASGWIDVEVPELAYLPQGALLIAQATVNFPGSVRERTNSVPLIAR